MLVMCVGCGAKKNTSGSVSMYDLRTAMEAADPDLPEMLNASSAEKMQKISFPIFLTWTIKSGQLFCKLFFGWTQSR